MRATAHPHDRTVDPERLQVLDELRIVGTQPEPMYDDLAILAMGLLQTEAAAVNLVEADQHWTKAVAGARGTPGGTVPNDVSLCAETVRRPSGVLAIADARTDPSWRDHPLVAGNPDVVFYAGAAITVAGQPVGVVCAFGPEPRAISPTEVRGLEALARQAAAHLELRRNNLALQRLATTDPLTGLANRTLVLDRLEQALQRCVRHGGEVAVAFCDVDDFKAINDRFGHEAGDRVLREIARELRHCVRTEDTVGRIAGDELVIVCPDIGDAAAAQRLAARLDEVGDRIRLPAPEARVGLSAGVVLAEPGETAGEVLARADAAMYVTKQGR